MLLIKRINGYGRYLIIFLLLIVLCVVFNFFPPLFYQLPTPTGPYAVATQSYALPNFTVRVWYPTDSIGKIQRMYANPSQNQLWIEQFAKRTHLPALLFSHAFDFTIVSQLNTKISHAHPSYPVIIFSPGSSVSYDNYEALLDNLASHGYIIVGFNTIPMQPVVFPNGRIVADAARVAIPRANGLLISKSQLGSKRIHFVTFNLSNGDGFLQELIICQVYPRCMAQQIPTTCFNKLIRRF